MSPIRTLYRRLLQIDHISVDRAMVAALPTADPVTLKLLVLSLLQRGRTQAGLEMILRFDHLPEELQAAVVQHSDGLHGAIRRACLHRSKQGPLNAIQIIDRSKSAKLAYLVVERLTHGHDESRAAAAAALLNLAAWASQTDTLPTDASTRCDTPSATYIHDATENAVELYRSHERPETLLAALHLTPRIVPGLRHHLLDNAAPAVRDLSQILELGRETCVRRAMLAVIAIPTLSKAVLIGLDAATKNDSLEDAMASAHLLINEPVKGPLRRATNADRWWPTSEQLEHWSPAALRSLARWASALPYDTDQHATRLRTLRRANDPLARLAALRALIGMDHTAANQVIAEYCHDPDPGVARIATRHLIHLRWDGLSSLLLKLVNSPHPAVRQLASRQLSPIAFKKLWDGWPHLGHAQRLAVGRALIKIDPEFHSHVQKRLSSADTPIRLRAVSIIHGLNQAVFFDQELIEMARTGEPKLAAMAVSALGRSGTDAAVRALEDALGHSDSRVRANAVEALQERRSTRHVQRLAAMARQEHNRPRANAIGALLEMHQTDAMKALKDMLADQRSRQRVSALWLAESSDRVQVARDVAEMSISDPDPNVQARAGRVVRHLIQVLEQGPVTTQDAHTPDATELAGARS